MNQTDSVTIKISEECKLSEIAGMLRHVAGLVDEGFLEGCDPDWALVAAPEKPGSGLPCEIRAMYLRKGNNYQEPGMDPIEVKERSDHGDTVLITGTNGEEDSLDIDTVVELLDRKVVPA